MRILILCLAVVMSLISGVASAEVLDRFSFEKGDITLQRTKNYQKYVKFNEQIMEVSVESAFIIDPIDLIEGSEEKVAAHNKFKNAAVVVSLGGTVCRVSHFWVYLEEGELKVTEPKGCDEFFKALFDGDRIGVVESSLSEGNDVTYWFDGRTVLTEYQEKPKVALDGNPYDPKYWVGRTAHEYVHAEFNEDFLAQSTGALRHIQYMTSWGLDDFTERDGWIISTSCRAGDCREYRLIVAISLDEGLPFFASRIGSDWRYFGNIHDPLPAILKNVLEENALNR